MKTRPEIPSSVYRLQLNKDFSLKKAIEILPYLKKLGIEGVYCSPFYEATNPHGYDITNSNRLNPIIGTEAEFDLFCSKIKKLGLFLIIDVVPNHMGMKKGQNAWWQDVLENGPYSQYASFFDINWSPEKRELQDKVLLPILGDSYGNALEKQEISLFLEEGNFYFQYFDFPLPASPNTYAKILEICQEELKSHPAFEEYVKLIDLYKQFPVTAAERAVKKEEGRELLIKLLETEPKIRKIVQQTIVLINGKKRFPESFDLMDKLLEMQYYRLAFWKVASHEINYRRFFNIYELVALCIEKQTVFNAHHKWILELLAEKKVQGFRIDHPDGLYDPVAYFIRLRKNGCLYTIVEKILDRKEELPKDWEVEGTVGYEYLNLLNGLFIKQDALGPFTIIYEQFIGKRLDFDEVVYESKKLFTHFHMVSEVESLALQLDRVSEKNRNFRDFTRIDLTNALQEVIACFPVYRTYIGPEGGVSKRDIKYIRKAISKAKEHSTNLDLSIFDFLERLLLLKLKLKEDEKDSYREFILRFQQLTGPIMAKGLEDTSFYIYNRFISLNEVGGDPLYFGNSIGDFHRYNLRVHEKWPYGFLATSSHDSKRNEDVRMRLNALSEVSEEWSSHVEKWAELNSSKKTGGAPSLNMEYFIYQTLIGIWPNELLNQKNEWTSFAERLWEILLKCMREAQQETSWVNPNDLYEQGVKAFLFSILSFDEENLFLNSFIPFQQMIDKLGKWNSLAMTGLKIGSCGVVDLYQGNETWNYCLVDPDNRRPIDFESRQETLATVQKEPFDSISFENAKLYLQWKALNFRREHKSLFLEGDYFPLKVFGKKKEHVIAFARKEEDKMIIICAARFFSVIFKKEDFHMQEWEDTVVLLPLEHDGENWEDLFTGKKLKTCEKGKQLAISAALLFEKFPVSYLYDPIKFT